MPAVAIEPSTGHLPPLPPPPPPSPPPPASPDEVEPSRVCILSETVRIGLRLVTVRGSRLDRSRSVYRMSHDAPTFDSLYLLGGYQSWWWKLLDWARGYYPEWFLPRNFILKVYQHSADRKDMGPSRSKRTRSSPHDEDEKCPDATE